MAVKSYDSWFHFGKDIYIIDTVPSITTEQIRLRLESSISIGKDKLLILEAQIKDVNGYLHENEWEWINICSNL